jgi:putative spermidine/putrescine transport system ATP-binding protein
MAMIELRKVSRSYGPVVALAEADLSIAKGEFVTVLGPSGSGKTTLLNLVAGMLRPTSGEIFIGGRNATDLPAGKRDLGMVFQNYALMPHMTIYENVAFPLRVRGLPRAEIRRRVHEVLELVRLPGVTARKPRELSGGQQQRVSLARCIVYNPALILMDEPLGALDKKLREQMQLEIKRLHTELGITILYVTHDQEEALTMSDRIVLMNKGRIEQAGSPDELYFRPVSVFAGDFLGDSNLLQGRVSAMGDMVCVDLGRRSVSAARPAFAPEPGQAVTVLVRPENMTVLGPDDAACENSLRARVVDAIVLGGVIKYHLALPDGTRVVAQELNQIRRRRLERDQEVTLTWRAEDSVLLRSDEKEGTR